MDDPEQVLDRFSDFCLVDLQLAQSTVYTHKSHIRKFLKGVDKPIYELLVSDVRAYLLKLNEGNPYTYSNTLKAMRRFFRDFLKRPDLVQSFKFPKINPTIKKVSGRDDLKEFYANLEDLREKAIFLLLSSSGLRRSEVLNLKLSDVDFEKRMLLPNHNSRTKNSYISFYNDEAEKEIKLWLKIRNKKSKKLFPMSTGDKHSLFVSTNKKTGLNITPQVLRKWFCVEMGRAGVPDRYVDAFCGRVPKTVLAKHYTDFNPEKLKQIYDKTKIKVLN